MKASIRLALDLQYKLAIGGCRPQYIVVTCGRQWYSLDRPDKGIELYEANVVIAYRLDKKCWGMLCSTHSIRVLKFVHIAQPLFL